MFRIGYGCLLRLPYRWPASGLPGQDCPRFVWRDDDVADSLNASDVSHLSARANEAD